MLNTWVLDKLNSQQVKKQKEGINIKEHEIEKEEGLFGPPQPKNVDNHIEHQIYVSD
jgi:uncharacterized protein YvpB